MHTQAGSSELSMLKSSVPHAGCCTILRNKWSKNPVFRYDRIRTSQETRIHPRRTESLTNLRHDHGSLVPGYLINPAKPSCTDYSPYPHAHRWGFSVPGLFDRPEGLQNNPQPK